VLGSGDGSRVLGCRRKGCVYFGVVNQPRLGIGRLLRSRSLGAPAGVALVSPQRRWPTCRHGPALPDVSPACTATPVLASRLGTSTPERTNCPATRTARPGQPVGLVKGDLVGSASVMERPWLAHMMASSLRGGAGEQHVGLHGGAARVVVVDEDDVAAAGGQLGAQFDGHGCSGGGEQPVLHVAGGRGRRRLGGVAIH
jgi:hypothetical protein